MFKNEIKYVKIYIKNSERLALSHANFLSRARARFLLVTKRIFNSGRSTGVATRIFHVSKIFSDCFRRQLVVWLSVFFSVSGSSDIRFLLLSESRKILHFASKIIRQNLKRCDTGNSNSFQLSHISLLVSSLPCFSTLFLLFIFVFIYLWHFSFYARAYCTGIQVATPLLTPNSF